MPKITKTLVDGLKPDPDKQVFVWDDTLKGFGVCVKPSGVKSFIVQYRTAEGVSRRMVIGKVGTLTPQQARDIADKKVIPSVKGGADPAGERRAARQGMTVGELCEWYLKEAAAGVILGRSNRPIKASTLVLVHPGGNGDPSDGKWLAGFGPAEGLGHGLVEIVDETSNFIS